MPTSTVRMSLSVVTMSGQRKSFQAFMKAKIASVASAGQALDQAQTGPKESEIAAARLQVDQAQRSVDQAAFSLNQAKRALTDAELVAPWDGTVLSVDSAVGAMLGAGTPILSLQDVENLEFHTTNLSERDLKGIEVGQSVVVTLKTYPRVEVEGKVFRVVPQASGVIGDAATFVVVVELEPSGLRLLPGMTGRAEIHHSG